MLILILGHFAFPMLVLAGRRFALNKQNLNRRGLVLCSRCYLCNFAAENPSLQYNERYLEHVCASGVQHVMPQTAKLLLLGQISKKTGKSLLLVIFQDSTEGKKPEALWRGIHHQTQTRNKMFLLNLFVKANWTL